MADPIDPSIPLPSSEGILATAGVTPGPWDPLKVLAQKILQEAEAEANLKATRDKAVDYLFAVIDALPIPAPVRAFLDGTKPYVIMLAEIGAK